MKQYKKFRKHKLNKLKFYERKKENNAKVFLMLFLIANFYN